ncbi:MAG: tetratricopeptide repeat protein [Limnothrix sp. BL-A-16]
MSDPQQPQENWQGLNIKGGTNDIHDNAFNQNHSGPGDNVAGDKNVTVQPTTQQGNVFDGQSQGHFYGPVNQYFVPPPLEPTIDGPPNNLTKYGLSPDRFVGRAADLARLHGLLQTQTQVAIAGVSGLGGVGKSELALQYARAHLGDYPGGVVWLRAAAACGELVAFAQPRWFAQVDFTPLDTLEKQAIFCQAHWPNTAQNPPGRVLLILDDVTDFGGQVQGFPVVGDRFRVLITSREKYLLPEARLDLEVLEPAAALALLSNLVGESRIAAEWATAEKLCEWLGYLPLGLELVGSYLAADPELSLAKMQQRLEQKRLAAKALTQVPATTTAERGVAAAFELSWQALSEEAQRLAVLLGCFGPAPVLWAWVEGCLPNDDEEDLEAARAELVRLSLLERLGDRQYGLHPLIREFFAAKLMDQADSLDLKIAVAGELLRATKSISQTMTLDQVQDLGAVIPHARAVAEWPDRAEAIADLLARLNNQLCSFYYSQGLFSLAEVWAKRSLEIHERLLGADHPDTATSLNNLAYLYSSQGRYEAAEPLLRRSLEIKERVLGADHPDTASSLNNLAGLYYSQGQYEAAEPLYRRSLEIHEQVLGADHPDTATSLNNLALLYQSQGQYEAAEPLFRRSLEICERLLGADHPDTATSLNNLAALYYSQGRYEAAEPLYRRSLEICERLLGADHPHTAQSLNNLAALYYSQGRYEAAEPLYRRSLEIREQVLGDDHPDTAQSLNNLAGLYYSQGRYEAAEPLYRRSLAIRERALGADHPLTATSLNNLAELYRSQGRYEAAEPLYQRSLEIWEQLLGADHPLTATSLNNLAELYHSQGQYEAAEPLYRRSLEIREQVLGDDHPDTASSLNNLAGLYESQGRYEAAEPLYRRCLEIFLEKLGQDHPNTQTGQKNFRIFVQTILEADRAADLSDHPLTQSLLQQLQNP